MEYKNQVIDSLDNQSIEEASWTPVSPSYPKALRYHILVVAALILPPPWIAFLVIPNFPIVLAIVVTVVSASVLSFLLFVWVPRRARHTKYLLRELDINLQHGSWWHSSTSIGINRIQHLEVTQGPIERALGLSKLAIFTAGGLKSDLKIPGLMVEVAQQLKSFLLDKVATEELKDELL